MYGFASGLPDAGGFAVVSVSIEREVDSVRIERWCLLFALTGCACLALEGCGTDSLAPETGTPAILQITTGSSSYGIEDTVVVIVSNKSDIDVHLSIRDHVLEQWKEGSWRVVPSSQEDGSCGPIITILRPGNSSIGMIRLPDGVSPGQYRYRFECVADSAMNLLPLNERVSTVFQVTS